MVPLLSLLPLLLSVSTSSASSQVSPIYSRDGAATGDKKCGNSMCVAAVVNGSTVEYTLSSLASGSVGWMGMGFGQIMAGSPMVIMWPNWDGTITISQRQASSEVMPEVVANPPRIATLSNDLSTSSSSGATFVYTIPANSDTKQSVIYAFGNINPNSADQAATLQEHSDMGTLTLDLTKALATTGSSSSDNSTTSTPAQPVDSGDDSDDTPFLPYQRTIVAHAITSTIGFALLLPSGVLLARYLRTFTPSWYTGHWIAQFGIAGPVIIAGVALAVRARDQLHATGKLDDHQRAGFAIFALYLGQCFLGAFIHWVKLPAIPRIMGRSPQNYTHALLGLVIICLGMYQIRTGYMTEWPRYGNRGDVPKGVDVLWIVWCILLPVLYAVGLAFLPKQYRQEAESRKGAMRSSSEFEMNRAE
ncbi:hypothetical protein FB45DRAFT_929900 [Roridomyces roridus]|uniref:CBD9-like protein n=1 Tax=Roridomyces roridus TaxID=1738132 RepID=A0AAD7BGP2_9AGAR|nr:hypothetical protein FB45DRAFT_929900 [Roridomyces roridus]